MLIGSAVLILVAAVGWLFILSPRLGTTAEIEEQTQSVAVSNTSRQHQLSELDKMKSEAPTAAGRVQKLISRMPQEADLPQMFNQITNAAKKAGIAGNAISTITPSVPEPLDTSGPVDPGTLTDAEQLAQRANFKVAKLDVTMSVTGSIGEIRQFLYNLEHLERDFLIREVTVTNAIEGKGDRVATVTATAFVLQSQLPDLVKDVNELLSELESKKADAG